KRLCLAPKRRASSTPIYAAEAGDFDALVRDAGGLAAAWAKASAFTPKPGRALLVPTPEGGVERVLLVVASGPEARWSYAAAAASLPAGGYHLEGAHEAEHAALGWALGSYRYERYRSRERKQPVLQWPSGVDRLKLRVTAEA